MIAAHSKISPPMPADRFGGRHPSAAETRLSKHRSQFGGTNNLRKMLIAIGVDQSAFSPKGGSFIQANRDRLEWLLNDARDSYKKRIVSCHPDRGGDSSQASALNALMSQIESRVHGILKPRLTPRFVPYSTRLKLSELSPEERANHIKAREKKWRAANRERYNALARIRNRRAYARRKALKQQTQLAA